MLHALESPGVHAHDRLRCKDPNEADALRTTETKGQSMKSCQAAF